jgi:hypothetical protein
VDGVRFLNPIPRAPSPNANTITFDSQPAWPLLVETAVPGLLIGISLLALALFGARGLAHLGARTAAVACALLALSFATAAAGYAALGRPLDAFLPAVNLLASAALAFAIAFDERRLPSALLAAGALAVAGRVAQDTAYADGARLLAQPPYLSAALLLAGGALLALRRRSLARALRGVSADAARYDAEWAAGAANPAHAAALARIDALATALSAAARPAAARHLLRARTRPAAAADSPLAWARSPGLSASRSFRFSNKDLSALDRDGPEALPVASLDQLYAQARAAADILARACAGWAAASGGAVREPPHPAAADIATSAGQLAGGAGPAGPWIKAPGRAAAKAAACYGGDVSRLLDLCRARIAFATPADLARALAALADSAGVGGPTPLAPVLPGLGAGMVRGVRVVRARSSMRPGSDAAAHGGFRVRPREHWSIAWSNRDPARVFRAALPGPDALDMFRPSRIVPLDPARLARAHPGRR